MLQAALADGTAHRRCVFEVFTRRLPAGPPLRGARRDRPGARGARDGSGSATAELDWLADERRGRRRARSRTWRTTGSPARSCGYAEGEVFFPSSPVMVVEGTFAEAVLLETLVLSILNYDSAVASAASRMTSAAVDRPCLEMGSRRAHEEAAVAAARAAVVAGFAGTSNLEAGRRYGLATIGTAAHAFTLLHDDEAAAFAAQVAALGRGHDAAGRHLRRAPRRRARAGGGRARGSVRCGSTPGDLGVLAHEVRAQLDAAGARSTRITVTSDLDEYAIAALAVGARGHLRRGHVGGDRVRARRRAGWSTSWSPARAPTGCSQPVAKAARGKTSVGGRKAAARRLGADGRAVEEVLVTGPDDDGRGAGSPTDATLRAAARPAGRPTAWSTRGGWAPTGCAGQQNGTAPRGTSCRAGRDGCRPTRQRCRPWRCGSGTEGPEPQRRSTAVCG